MGSENGAVLDLLSARQELYGTAPSDFVATRGALAKRAKAAGDADLAREIQAMRKPTVAAWLVNQLARRHPEELGELLELGRDMREGMGGLDADGMRDLTRRRHRLVASLVALAREVAHEGGHRVGDEVARAVQTCLEATLSDAESADAVREGCLAEPLEVSGFGAAFAFGPAAGERPSLRSVESDAAGEDGASVTDLSDRRARKAAETEEAEQSLADAELLSQRAQSAYDQAREHTAEFQRDADDTSERIDRLQAELDEARADLAERTQAAKAARLAESDAEKALHAATRALAAATERLRRLRR